MKGFVELKLVKDAPTATINVSTIAYFYPTAQNNHTVIILTTSKGAEEIIAVYPYADVRKKIEDAMK